MKLGILNACTPEEESEFGTQEFATFRDFFDLTEHNLTLVEYRVTEGQFPESPDACDAFLITGSPAGIYDNHFWIEQLSHFVMDCYAQRKKMVGICFGHQLLAHTLGGHAQKSEKGWGLGIGQVAITKPQPWMNPSLPQGAFYFCHQDQVVQLPEEATLLAGNEFCPNGMFVMDDHVLGVQAHPEFTAEVMGQAIEWFRSKGEIEEIDSIAVATAERAADNGIMAQWVVNFLAS